MAGHATKTADELWDLQSEDPHRFGGVEQSEEGMFDPILSYPIPSTQPLYAALPSSPFLSPFPSTKETMNHLPRTTHDTTPKNPLTTNRVHLSECSHTHAQKYSPKMDLEQLLRRSRRPALVRALAQPGRLVHARGAAGGVGVSDRRAVRPRAPGGRVPTAEALELLRVERAVQCAWWGCEVRRCVVLRCVACIAIFLVFVFFLSLTHSLCNTPPPSLSHGSSFRSEL